MGRLKNFGVQGKKPSGGYGLQPSPPVLIGLMAVPLTLIAPLCFGLSEIFDYSQPIISGYTRERKRYRKGSKNSRKVDERERERGEHEFQKERERQRK